MVPSPQFDDSLYQELRSYVVRMMDRGERKNHTLQPTEVVHEVFLRVAKHQERLNDRNHLQAVAARAAHHVLVDHARSRKAQKRGEPDKRLTLVDAHAVRAGTPLDILVIEDALQKLGERWPRQREIALLRLWEMTVKEIGSALGLEETAVRRQWALARAFLRRELNREGDPR